jgi:hypothetical protein
MFNPLQNIFRRPCFDGKEQETTTISNVIQSCAKDCAFQYGFVTSSLRCLAKDQYVLAVWVTMAPLLHGVPNLEINPRKRRLLTVGILEASVLRPVFHHSQPPETQQDSQS